MELSGVDHASELRWTQTEPVRSVELLRNVCPSGRVIDVGGGISALDYWTMTIARQFHAKQDSSDSAGLCVHSAGLATSVSGIQCARANHQ